MRPLRSIGMLLAVVLLSACSQEQSALAPRGDEAEQVGILFAVMSAFLSLVLVAVVALAVLAWTGHGRLRAWLAEERFVLAGGLFFPVAALTALFVGGLLIMATRTSAVGEPDVARATITGEQWWWRVVYALADGRTIESANELAIPVGVPAVLDLETADVIHSFWVPNLAGKLDMIPGRTNTLTLKATEAGISRGQCAEYCGGAHAFMAFHVVALEPEDFAAWIEHQAADATSDTGSRGARLFATFGCGGCHTIRGTAANGVIGPDLTHVGSRRSLAAATLPNDVEGFARWIRDNQHIKPGNRMPPYTVLSDDDLLALATYLDGLE
jgi:cytochrome c oxidase subunit 2